MPQQYSPIDGSELDGPDRFYPKAAFLMLHDNELVSALESQAQKVVRDVLGESGIKIKTASELKRSGDYLLKIIRLIQGCGLGIAVFSEATPPKTLANIFFEVGYCLALGKPTQLILCGDAEAPSDFVRSEWIRFPSMKSVAEFKDEIGRLADAFSEYGEFYNDLANTAEDAEEIDPELIFERYKRAFLITGDTSALDGIRRIHSRIRKLSDMQRVGELMNANRRNLSDEMNRFLRIVHK